MAYGFGVGKNVKTTTQKESKYGFGITPKTQVNSAEQKRSQALAKFGITDTEPIKMTRPSTIGGKQSGFEFTPISQAPITEASKALARDISQEQKNQLRGGNFADTNIEIDHIVPVSLGGTKADYNLQGLSSDKIRQEGKLLVELDNITKFKNGEITQGQAIYNILQYSWANEEKKKAIEQQSFSTNPFSIALNQTVSKAKKFFNTFINAPKDFVKEAIPAAGNATLEALDIMDRAGKTAVAIAGGGVAIPLTQLLTDKSKEQITRDYLEFVADQAEGGDKDFVHQVAQDIVKSNIPMPLKITSLTGLGLSEFGNPAYFIPAEKIFVPVFEKLGTKTVVKELGINTLKREIGGAPGGEVISKDLAKEIAKYPNKRELLDAAKKGEVYSKEISPRGKVGEIAGVKPSAEIQVKGKYNFGIDKAKVIEPKQIETNSLEQEARKYKSAEEFVKAQGTPVYRGGEKFTGDVGERGLPLTTNKAIAETFAKEKKAFRENPAGQIMGLKSEDIILEEYLISPSAKIATKKDIPNNIFEAYKKANPVTTPEIAEPIISKWARNNGFDAVDFSTLGKTSAKEAEIKILNKDIIKTKSQLTDIWNKANKTALGEVKKMPTKTVLGSLEQEARKYKSAEEFKKAYTQKHLMDLSDYDKHRFGRALVPLDEGGKDTVYNIVNGLEGHSKDGYLTDIKYTYPDIYKKITSPGNTIEVYRAVPKNAPSELQVGDYIALIEDYAKGHGEQVLKGEQKTGYKIIKEEISKKDIIWGQADFAEWAYSPQQLRDQYPKGLVDIWNKANKLKKTAIGEKVVSVPRSQLPVEPAFGKGNTKVSRLAARLKNNLDTLTEKQKELLPQYKAINRESQLNSAAKFVENSREDAMAVLRGQKEAPKGLLYESIARAMFEKAQISSDTALVRDLASLRATRFGQELSMLVGIDEYNSAVILSKLKNTRIKALRAKGKSVTKTTKKEVSRIKDSINRTAPKKDEWVSFLEEIKC